MNKTLSAITAASLLCVGAICASTPASANLILSASGSGITGTDTLASSATNTSVNFAGTPGTSPFTLALSAFGNASLAPPALLDVANFDLSTAAAGNITIEITETNLTAGAFADFITSLTGTLSQMTATRSIFLDTTNSGLETTLLCQTSKGGSPDCSTPLSLTGPFSITEQISATATTTGGFLSSDDTVVPEPSSLALFGAALLGLGLVFRRGRKSI